MNQPVDNLAKNINLMGRPREIINQCYYNLLAMYFLCWKDKSQALSIGRMLLDQCSAREVNGEHASFGKGPCLLKNKQAPQTDSTGWFVLLLFCKKKFLEQSP